MPNAILVLNAGSSSLKFSIFGVEKGTGEPLVRGQVEGIGTAPRFLVRRTSGEVIETQSLEGGESLDHEQALRYVFDRCPSWLGDYRIVAAGHRVVHGGVKFAEPVAVTPGVLGGLDALVFTGSIGENAAAIRGRICRDAVWLGVMLDEEANGKGGKRMSPADCDTAILVIPTNEELMIAKHTRRVLGLNGADA